MLLLMLLLLLFLVMLMLRRILYANMHNHWMFNPKLETINIKDNYTSNYGTLKHILVNIYVQ